MKTITTVMLLIRNFIVIIMNLQQNDIESSRHNNFYEVIVVLVSL